MASLVRRFAAALLLGGFAVVCSGFAADDKKKDDKKKDDTLPDIHAIMAENKDKIAGKINTAAKAEKWDDAAKIAKIFKEHGIALGKNKPEKGTAESWAKFSKKYADDTAAVSDAVDKKDAKAVDKAVTEFGKGCGGCHKAHK